MYSSRRYQWQSWQIFIAGFLSSIALLIMIAEVTPRPWFVDRVNAAAEANTN